MSDSPDRKHVKQVAAKDIKARGNVSIGKIVQIANQTINHIVKPAYHRSPSVWLAQGGLVIALIVLLVAAIKGGFSSSNSLSTTYAPSTTVENKNTFLINNPPSLSLLSKASPSEAEKKDAQQKVAQYQQEVQKNPNSAVAHTNLGEALRRTGDLEGSSKEHQKALQLNPKLQEAKVGQALVEQDQGKSEAAIKAILDALTQEKDPKVLAFIYFHLGGIFYFHEPPHLKDAEAALQKSIELDSNNGHVYTLLGGVKISQDNLKEGIAYLEKAKDLFKVRGNIQMVKRNNKLLGIAHTILADTLREQFKLDQAVAESQKAIALYPNYADPYNILGTTLTVQGKSTEAVKPLKKARDLYRAEGKTLEADMVDKQLQKLGSQ